MHRGSQLISDPLGAATDVADDGHRRCLVHIEPDGLGRVSCEELAVNDRGRRVKQTIQRTRARSTSDQRRLRGKASAAYRDGCS